eukprot:TRINITY_DN270_c0_g1_i1.p1 TRINITY_DN270_c0_g1~~TRINITY_DN270_c0_g1_i1.p1  ORF type:complete len:4523 (-),score=1222.92 TRINITY_DN270_c0_g1_i1:192-13760(-)
MALDGRQKYIIARCVEAFGLEVRSDVEESISDSRAQKIVKEFLSGEDPPRLFIYKREKNVDEAEGTGALGTNFVVGNGDDFSVSSSQSGVYFVRHTEPGVAVSTKENDIIQELTFGVISGTSALNAMHQILEDVYFPLLQEQQDWGKAAEEGKVEFMSTMRKFEETLSNVVVVQQEGIELRKPDRRYTVSFTPAGFARASEDPQVVAHFEDVVEDWCSAAERLLREDESGRGEPEDAGPDTELDYWRTRMGKFNSVTEQLKKRSCKTVLGVLQQARSKVLRKWRTLDMQITDSANEAKDNVKYLSTLETFLEPLYTGTPTTIIDSLPSLMNNLKMMHTISRYYNTTERMTTLFVKITNEMIRNCVKSIRAHGSLWEQSPQELITRLDLCLRLNESYQEHYQMTKEKMMTQPGGKQFDFNKFQIFGKFELFCKRIQKLIYVFSTVEQFGALSRHNIDGMETLISRFDEVVDELRKKPYDLLDHTKAQFDRDYAEFNKSIEGLETALQVFINASFENITSTENALMLLRKFQSILQRENLMADLDSKYMVIFHNYGLDLENVQKAYERFKHNPPIVRNAPPVTGNIMWARQLLRRIEVPMRRFQVNEAVMETKESKKIIKTYNRVARALVEFETLWHYAWMKSIDTARAGLQATLIVRHPETGKLFVNFDHEILQLIKETKWLLRLGVEVPESAKMVLLQEDKFKSYYNQLTYALGEYERVAQRIIPIVRPIMQPHLNDLERKIQPGMTVLTWTSMNIDGYLHRIHQGSIKLEDLVGKINDIIENRIEKNLKTISKTLLVDLPHDESFTLDQFVAAQERHIKTLTEHINQKNIEVERAVDDLMTTISGMPLEHVEVTPEQWNLEINRLKQHYNRLMFKAILSATTKSLQAIRERIGSRGSSGILTVKRPFFRVDVELQPPNVIMNPPLDDVQEAINRAAIAVLRCSKHVFQWKPSTTTQDVESDPTTTPASVDDTSKDAETVGERVSFHTEIARNPEIVKVVLLLTGGIHGLKQHVYDYLKTFRRYDYLWKENKHEAYEQFVRQGPTLEDFEEELKKYVDIENEINAITPIFNIGSLSLHTQPLKHSFRAEAGAWKAQYAKNLHVKARKELDRITTYISETSKKLQRDINDLEDLRFVMATLREIREKESEIDIEIGPVDEMYHILDRYEVRGVSKDETDAVADLRYSWKKLVSQASETTEKISGLQSGFKKDLITSVKQFKVDVIAFRNDYESNGPNVRGITPHEAMERLKKYQRLYEEKERKYETYAVGEELFGLPKEDYPDLVKIKRELVLLDKLYSLYIEVIDRVNGYADVLWVDLDIEAVTGELDLYSKRCRQLPKSLREWEAYVELRKTIDDFMEIQPLLLTLKDRRIRQRHWLEVMRVTGHEINLDEEIFRLKHLLEANILAHKEDIEEVGVCAVNEAEIESKLKGVQDDWANQILQFAEFKNKGPIILVGSEAMSILEKLEDSQMTLGSMMSSRYLTPFRSEATDWIEKLSTVNEVLEMWVGVQGMYIYLEAVFVSGDIARQLPQEAKRFNNIEKTWLKVMAKANEVRNVVQFCYGNNPMSSLVFMKDQLELCQKSLSGYLEQKRNCFPRFYFVSDPVLLEILSQASDPRAIQKHMISVFASISGVEFDRREKNKIISIVSPEDEIVPLEDPVLCKGNVEDWLNVLERAMQSTVKSVVKMSVGESESMKLDEFIKRFPAQVALLGIQFMWTADCQDALIRSKTERRAMSDAMKKIQNTLSQLTLMASQELPPLDRTKIETLVTIQVHQKDVFEDLMRKRIRDISDFEWQKQARFYWSTDVDNAVISIADIDFRYCYEFMGCKERLVITPLTDRCYISLSQALGMHLGGAPAGPAGTGKTETVKDLGRALGKYVVVFNCSDQMDFRAMGKIFKGLAQSGAWGCFDEFNRIKLEVLSVVAQQIQCVLQAIRDRQESFVFTDGQKCRLRPETGFFITMNPGYQGRQELPENLKALFRGVAMMVPDRRIIIKVKLAASGFEENNNLSIKFDILYRLCEQQLSKQPHYDFGLRNILSVLRTAGVTKRAEPTKKEALVLMRTLRDMNLSKLVAEDVPLFLSLINDLFPGLKPEKAQFATIEKAIDKYLAESGFVKHKAWFEKVIQLYETSLVRHGIMVVGPSGAGKSTCYKALMRALTDTVKPHKMFRMNPKAITAPQMFGRLDPISNDWTDGIFSALWRKANDPVQMRNTNVWIVCDGPVDAIWIENLNTVLDDNKLLTLANGDRIQMSPDVKMCFEVENLNNASPATVSRAGQIYMSASVLDWLPVLQSKLSNETQRKDVVVEDVTLQPAHAKQLLELFENHVDKAFEFLRKECAPVMAVSRVGQASSMFDMLLSLLAEVYESQKDAVEALHVERLFWFSLFWCLGGVLERKDRVKFSDFILDNALCVPDLLPGTDVFEYFVDESTGNWSHWNERIPEWVYPGDENFEFSTLFVPTLDSVRIEYLLSLYTRRQKGVLLVGGPGTAKTVTIENLLRRNNPEVMLFKKMNFSSATTPHMFQKSLEANIDKRVGNSYGPPGGRKMTVFIDDISMPEINEWGDQVTNEIVRQVLEDGGFFSLDKPGEWKRIVDLQFVSAMSHPGGGRNDIPPRLKRHFAIFNVTLPSHTAIDQIYGTLIRGRYNAASGFKSDVLQVVMNMTKATIRLWEEISIKMLPTPSKVHYIFNIRDLSRVFQGVMQCTPQLVSSGEFLLDLWKHECTRVFSDRLNDVEDKIWYDKTIETLIKSEYGQEYAKVASRNKYFVDFLRDAKVDPETGEAIEDRPMVYEPAPSLEHLTDRLYDFMESYNDEHKVRKLDLVLFDSAVKHLVRITRILRLPRGNALVVGVGGSGRQSLTRLASFIEGCDVFQIVLTKTYGEQNLLEDLQKLYRKTGLDGKPVTFIFTDNDIKKESFLEYINQILSSGEVPGLFPKEELDLIINDLRDVAKATKPDTVGKNDTWDNLYRFFIDRVRDNLHVVLCFSPVGEKFRTRARKFPALISGCLIDWFFPWPKDALIEVAARSLHDFKLDATDLVRTRVVELMAQIHSSMDSVSTKYFNRFRRHAYTTPRSFLSFLDNFRKMYMTKYEEVQSLATKVDSGLQKLEKAAEDVEAMKVSLKEKEKNLEKAQKKTDEMLKTISESTAKAEKKRGDVKAVKDALAEDAAIVSAGKEEAEKDLEAAKPALVRAENALKAITPKDIQNLRALRNPPQLVKTIFDGVLLLKRLPINPSEVGDLKGRAIIKDSFPQALQMMVDQGFLNSLLNYDRDSVDDEIVELCQPYLQMEDWDADKARSASGNVAGLCTWVSSMCLYHEVAKIVQPKIIALREAEAQLRVANARLKAKEDELAVVEEELNKIQQEFDSMMKKKQELQEDADRTRKRMTSANNLIQALSGERGRWQRQSQEFADRIRRLVGDAAIVSAFISYCGPYNSEFRSLLQRDVFHRGCIDLEIPVTDDLRVTQFLVDAAMVGEWNLQGLPNDDHSIQNGIMVTRSSKWPLLIDPQGQGLAWLMHREEGNEVQVVELGHKHMRNILEDAISYGRSLIIENVEEELDPFLDPILDKAVSKSGRSYQIVLGDKTISYNENFRLFVTTKLANPHFSPELSAKMMLIDFTVTMSGLEEQLLGRVIQMEKAELEEQRERLLQEVNVNQKKIKSLEDDLLHRLSESQGNLLDDEELVDVLAVTKQTASEVEENLAKAVEMEKRISASREEYRPVAIRGSVIYFLVVEMSLVNPMYQTSLKQFLVLFDTSIEKAERALITSKRINNIIEYVTFSSHLYVSRGLFECHKLLFVMLLACKILLRDEKISYREFNTFLKGGAALDINSVRKKPMDWVPDSAWLNICELSNVLDKFRDLPDSVQRNSTLWKKWYDSAKPESTPIPEKAELLTPFETMLIVRAIREDRASIAASDFISVTLGSRFVESVPLNLEDIWEESTATTPLVCLLSLGSDPTSLIESLAKKVHKAPVRSISMGQGQEEAAQRLIMTGFLQGSWVLLQNCHLGLDFLIEVEKMIATAEEINPEFRLWITSEPHPRFPIGLLQMSIKLTNEAPQGVKAGLKRSFQWVSQDMLESFQRPEWRPLLYATCFMHTVVQERRKFGPLGWNVPYEFNHSDLAASVRFLQNHLTTVGEDTKRGVLGWSTIKYMICEVQYGGRITDDFDRRLCNTYGELWLTPDVVSHEFEFFPGYSIPHSEEIAKIRDHIEQLPLNDTPEVFGMHKNGDITYRTRQSREVLSTILEIQPKEAGSTVGESPVDIVLHGADEMLAQVPIDFDRDRTKDYIKRLGGATPLNIFLSQEIDRFQTVIDVVRTSLTDLKLAIGGTIIMSAALQDTFNAIFDARVPRNWDKVSWASPTLGIWFANFLRRHGQLTQWLETGKLKTFWLTGFFNPQGFLTAVRQEVTRAHKWALDDVVLRTEVTNREESELRDVPTEGVYIHGLFLEGAQWDKRHDCLVEQAPKILFSPLPVLYVTAMVASEKKKTQTYVCPCYTNPSRTDLNYIFDVELKTSEAPAHWIMRGVALLCSSQ